MLLPTVTSGEREKYRSTSGESLPCHSTSGHSFHVRPALQSVLLRARADCAPRPDPHKARCRCMAGCLADGQHCAPDVSDDVDAVPHLVPRRLPQTASTAGVRALATHVKPPHMPPDSQGRRDPVPSSMHHKLRGRPTQALPWSLPIHSLGCVCVSGRLVVVP